MFVVPPYRAGQFHPRDGRIRHRMPTSPGLQQKCCKSSPNHLPEAEALGFRHDGVADELVRRALE
jgi:hypothetical protein